MQHHDYRVNPVVRNTRLDGHGMVYSPISPLQSLVAAGVGVLSFTVPNNAVAAMFNWSAGSNRYVVDGVTTPTAAIGSNGQNLIVPVIPGSVVRVFASAAGTTNVQFFEGV